MGVGEQGVSGSGLPEAVRAVFDRVVEQNEHLRPSCDGLLASYEAIVKAFEDSGILYLCGNGGSFADAMHIKGELAKSFVLPRPIVNKMVLAKLSCTEMGKRLADSVEMALPVVVLGESHSLRSAYANDRDGVLAYAQELNSFAGRIKNGVLMGISTSGNAENVLAAMTLARAYGLTTISFTGPGGGKMAELADIVWKSPGESTPEVQESQLPLYHALCLMVEAFFFGTP